MQFALTDTYQDYFNNSSNLNTFSFIRALHSNQIGYGLGATRHYANHIFNSLLNAKIITLNGYFLNFNSKNDYLHSKSRMQKFCHLIKITIQANGTLPFHLNPHILEIILGPMPVPILEYFYEKMHPTISKSLETNAYDTACKELGYNFAEAHMRDHLLIKSSTSLDWLFASTLVRIFKVDLVYESSHIDLDQKISGNFTLTHPMVLNITKIDSQYESLWKEFITELNSTELTDMLYYFTNNKSCDSPIQINVSPNLELDIKVETCFNIVYISESYFTDISTLRKLKESWSGSTSKTDNLFDGESMFSANTTWMGAGPLRGRLLNIEIDGPDHHPLVQAEGRVFRQQNNSFMLGVESNPVTINTSAPRTGGEGLRLGEMERDAIRTYRQSRRTYAPIIRTPSLNADFDGDTMSTFSISTSLEIEWAFTREVARRYRELQTTLRSLAIESNITLRSPRRTTGILDTFMTGRHYGPTREILNDFCMMHINLELRVPWRPSQLAVRRLYHIIYDRILFVYGSGIALVRLLKLT